jgi:hypothetical protein
MAEQLTMTEEDVDANGVGFDENGVGFFDYEGE